MSKKICVISGTRAEWYLLQNLCKKIKNDKDLTLQLIVTAAHLSQDFGFTYQEIEKEFKIDKKISMLLSNDDNIALCKSMGLLQISLCEALDELKPDIVVILGDRYEMLAVASTCLMMQIPIAHLCGGELSFGAIDESIRHAIAKMSHLHFASAQEYVNRIIQLGEEKQRVFNVGSIGGEIIENMKFLNKNSLQKELNIKFNKNIYLITYHPQTLNLQDNKKEITQLLNFLDNLENSTLIFTKANADENGIMINNMINEYCIKNKNKAKLFDNLGSLKYLSLMKIATAVIGNSSSGICESPFFKTPCINIGDRQKGRICADNIINAKINKLNDALKILNSSTYKNNVKNMKNPFSNKNASQNIINVLKNKNLKTLFYKEFVDL
ncbi:UDP-N-acetylglucosamine 2-epimerase (hydrolyzing) [Campylobacter lari]|uniref:UDP-N-acetylglucosamine 2-epimerase n=3 Tax=Campylobacter lari TaxID=201 RepID=UPI0008740F27|nr:UDP-N-acetylglucosamine 2-epimerase [Campylobacter lari]EAH4935164.1 UDP-N-acetylglucosamine 2-epimerase (hydrolyzing) [Campylobacter lari]EAH7837383.1 UDP-N-acetylglucosamine 2-epimerase (hydrolyzing) [Campylobacter lari]EAI2083206.1 UDP-N-acetylglucosamine 2-epimerase (hydrolyzing) [Campylobacter lari]EAI2315241.1 UDP-N-acetylglucosamine 2-epimerase (hydrolyzing) [Campylobacter lari]EAI2404464.1 UDP-N-acetylglucosamine 2-epimerase (hydrolyzing) [Campylobacter lari]